MYSSRRTNNAYSVALVVSIGSIAILSSMAVLASMLTGERYSSKQLQEERCLHNAEMALNCTINQLNQAANNNSLNNLTTPIILPAALKEMALNPNITIASISIPNPLTTAYVSTILPYPSQQFDVTNPDYRIITALSQIGNTKRKITALVARTTIHSPQKSSGTPMFNYGMQANGTLSLTNVTLTGAAPSDSYIATNTKLTQGPENKLPFSIPGTVTVYNKDGNSPQKPVTIDLPEKSTIGGNLNYNGKTNGFQPIPDDGSSSEDATVYGDGLRNGLNGQVNASQAIPTYQSPLLEPNASPTYTTSGSGNINQIKIDNVNFNSVAQIGSVTAGTPPHSQVMQSSTLNLNPGTYITNNLSVYSDGTLNLPGLTSGSTSGQSSVAISIQDAITSSNSSNSEGVFNFEGNLSGQLTGATAKPQDFQIYYNGNQPINISLKNLPSDGKFAALIYAPNAPVTVELYGRTFAGAIVSNDLNLFGQSKSPSEGKQPPGTFDFKPDYISTSNSSTSKVPSLMTAAVTSPNGRQINVIQGRYKVISWQESSQF